MTKTQALEKLAKALLKVTDGQLGEPKVMTPDKDGWEQHTLAWDGPFEWTMCLSGRCSLYAGEFGCYSKPIQKELGEVLDEIEEYWFLEPINNCWIGIYEK